MSMIQKFIELCDEMKVLLIAGAVFMCWNWIANIAEKGNKNDDED